MRNDHAHGAKRQTEDARQLLAHRKRTLRRAPYGENLPFELRHAHVGLHRIMLGAGEMKTVFKDLIGIAKSIFDIAALMTKMKTDVALIVHDVLAAPTVTGIFAVFE